MAQSGSGSAERGPTVAVLIVDDEQLNIDVCRRTLAPSFEVEGFTSPLAALKRLGERAFAAVIVDLRMPELNGVDFLERALQVAPRTPRLLVTGYADAEAVIEAVNRGRVNGILLKPLDVDRLRMEIDAAAATAQPPAEATDAAERIRHVERSLHRERTMRREIETYLEDRTRDLYVATQKAAEQQAALVQTEKLSMIGSVSAGIAHEINNALNFVHGNLQHLERYVQIYDELLDAYREAVKNSDAAASLRALEERRRLPFIKRDLPKLLPAIATGVRRATEIVRDLGVFARPADLASMCPTDLARPLDTALTLAANRLKHKRPVKRVVEATPPVLCNSGGISQVFLNLLFNASDAIADDTGEIEVRIYVERDRVVSAVHDNGGGIPHDKQHRLFEPFFTTKEPGKGTGLGLFVSRRIVEQNGGLLWFSSDPGHGTTFYLSLPAAGAHRPEEPR